MTIDMRTERAEEAVGVGTLQDMDEGAFADLTERHRRELHVHCYRMLGSFQDAEDAVQETFLKAWRARETYEGRSTVRAWLYRIATNTCLDLIARRRPEPARGGEVRWLQPYPDSLLDELPADGADDPESKALARETIELAYVVAVQHLAPRPRAALILRDVMGWPAKEVADLLGDSVNSVNSALQRARAGMRAHLPSERQEWTGDEGDVGNRDLVRRFTDASVAADIDTVAGMLREDVRYSMPPWEGLVVGRDARAGSPLHRRQRGHGHRPTRRHAAGRRPLLDAAHAGPVRRPRQRGEQLVRGWLRGPGAPARSPNRC